jgi:hypothetical protein
MTQDAVQDALVTAEQAEQALVACDGNISAAARSLGVKRSKFKERIDRTPELVKLLEDLREEVIDDAESNMFSAAKKGDLGAAKFVLTTIGKARGYVTRVESTGKDGESHAVGMREEVGRLLDGIAARIPSGEGTPEISG